MVDLSTTYMGLKLQNPVLVGSCSLTKTEERLQRCADFGPGAIVLKSLFEEQIQADSNAVQDHLWMSSHTEAFDYVSKLSMELGPSEYLKLIENAKKYTNIPVIASLNCVSSKWWVGYAKQIVGAGADAMEVNISAIPCDPKHTGQEVEKLHLEILQEVKSAISIPVAVKIGPYFSSLANLAQKLVAQGANALVLFNRFYQMDIDIDKMEIIAGHRFSSSLELNLALRFISILAGKVPCDIAASTGVHEAADAIKQILAGAKVVQLCSSLYLNQLKQIEKVKLGIEDWMKKHQIENLDSVRGKLSQCQSHQPEIYEHLQYIKALVSID